MAQVSDSSDNISGLINKYKSGYLEKRADGQRVLYLKGTAYERGYQRGMLQDDLASVTCLNITQLATLYGGDDLDAGLIKLHQAKKIMEPFIPYQIKDEIRGMADALASRGELVTYDDIILHLIGADYGMMNSKNELSRTPGRSTFPSISRCSSFSAWGTATKDGSLIIAGNSDYYDREDELNNRPIAIIDPTDGGYGYTGALWDVFFVASGMNEKGIAIHGHLVGSDSESLKGVSAELLLKHVLQYSDSIEDAVEILTVYPRTCGIIIHIADANTNQAAIIEYTADDISVRFSEPGMDALWSTNHFNCFPGWQGYSGVNMVVHQVKRAGFSNVNTIKDWQNSLEKVGKGRAGRYGRYEYLLSKIYGEISIETAKNIIRDRFSLKQSRILDPSEQTNWKDYPIMTYQKDWVMSKKINFYKGNSGGELVVKSGTVSSFIATPLNGDIWWAVGLPPAGYTRQYHKINLHQELARIRMQR